MWPVIISISIVPSHAAHRYIWRSWRTSSHSTANMATNLGLVTCLAVLACLLHPSLSDHKKRIIVKVPHVIKHIHHSHFKPVHIHKVHAKKVEHYHHDKKEESGGWKQAHKKESLKHKEHGSFSHLKPVLVHQNIEEHMEYPEGFGQEYDYGQGHDMAHSLEYSDVGEGMWKSENDHGKWKANYNSGGSQEDSRRWGSFEMGRWMNGGPSKSEFSGEDWMMSSEEDLPDIRGEHIFSREKGPFRNGHKQKTPKQLNWRTKHIGQEQYEDGWKPMMDFSGWKDIKDITPHSSEHHNDPFNHSGEEFSEGSSGEQNIHPERWAPRNNHNKKKNQKKNKKREKWSKQIEVREPGSEEEPQQHDQRPVQQQSYPYQVERPIVAQNSPQALQSQPVQLQKQQTTPWPLPVQQPQPVQNRWPALPQPQQQQWHAQQQPATAWHQQPAPQPQPTKATQPTVVWSGHHLQLPQHSMWHVQQHSVQAVPVQTVPLQALPVTHNPRPVLPFHPPSFLPLNQAPSSQQQQASAPLQHVLPSNWPRDQRSQNPQVKQQWEQSVQTSGSGGPASSYKVEVINYMDQSRSH